MRPVKAIRHTIVSSLVLCAVTLSSIAHANISRSTSVAPATARSAPANRIALVVNGKAACEVALTSDLAPSYVNVAEDSEPSGTLPACDAAAYTKIREVSQLARNENRTALLPLAAMPLIVCVASAAVSGLAAHYAVDERPRLLSFAGVALIFTPSLTTSASVLGAAMTASSAAWGSTAVISAGCSVVGGAIGLIYYRITR